MYPWKGKIEAMNDSNKHTGIDAAVRIVLPVVTVLALTIGCFLLGRITSPAREQDAAVTVPLMESGQEANALEQEPTEPGPRLRISAVENQDDAVYKLSAKGFNTNLGDVTYHHLSNVEIELDGTVMPLEDALLDGKISVPQLAAWARMDANDKFCTQIAESKNGITQFVYGYNQFDFRVVYDILEAPDGEQHLIQAAGFYPPGRCPGVSSFGFTDEDGLLLTRENWGLTFEVVEATPSGITFQATQSGGQQLGELHIIRYSLSSKTEEKDVGNDDQDVILEKDSTTSVTWDWSETFGELSSGTYILSFTVCDHFDKEQVNPLMRDFHDIQSYGFAFIIP